MHDTLLQALRPHFPLHRTRLHLMVQLLCAMLTLGTVRLPRLAAYLESSGTSEAHRYRRLQRFFAGLELDLKWLVTFVMACLPEGKHWLILDRTNWKWGKTDLNILMVAVLVGPLAIPLLWEVLPHGGCSSQKDRQDLLERLFAIVPFQRFVGLIADREFLGESWFRWIRKQGLKVCIRLKRDTLVDGLGKFKGFQAGSLFVTVSSGEYRIWYRKIRMYGVLLRLVATRTTKGDLLLIATDLPGRSALPTYAWRWKIECLFEQFKSHGFDLESTRMTDPDKLGRLLILVSLAYLWCVRMGAALEGEVPTGVKAHGRKALSTFQRGFSHLRVALFAALRGMLEGLLEVLQTLLPLRPPETPVVDRPKLSLQRKVIAF